MGHPHQDLRRGIAAIPTRHPSRWTDRNHEGARHVAHKRHASGTHQGQSSSPLQGRLPTKTPIPARCHPGHPRTNDSGHDLYNKPFIHIVTITQAAITQATMSLSFALFLLIASTTRLIAGKRVWCRGKQIAGAGDTGGRFRLADEIDRGRKLPTKHGAHRCLAKAAWRDMHGALEHAEQQEQPVVQCGQHACV